MVKHLSIFACGITLAACSSSGDLMRTATPAVPLQFESSPPGAEIKTSGGQTCRTPCALAVPAADFQVTYSLNGYQPQTIPVKLIPPEDMRGTEEMGLTGSQPRFDPNPVVAELTRATPRRAPVKRPQVAKQPPSDAPAPRQAPRTTDSGFAPPPSTSGFNPPPQNSGGGFGQSQQQNPAAAWPAPSQKR